MHTLSRNNKQEKQTEIINNKSKTFDVWHFLFQICTIIIPIIWFSWLYPDFKYIWHLANAETDKPTFLGIVINCVIVIIVLFAVLKFSMKDANAKNIIKQLEEKYTLSLSRINYHDNERNNIRNVCANKVSVLLDFIKDNKHYVNYRYEHCKYFDIITNPSEQIDCIIEQMCSNVGKVLDLNLLHCNISVACRFDINSQWEWLSNYTPIKGEDLELLTSQLTSTLNKVTSMKGTHFICYTSKKKAFEAQEYFIENIKNINDGLIIAKHYYVAIDSIPFAELVVFINSKSDMPDKKLLAVSNTINELKEELDDLVFKSYNEYIQIELMLRYIELINESNTRG